VRRQATCLDPDAIHRANRTSQRLYEKHGFAAVEKSFFVRGRR